MGGGGGGGVLFSRRCEIAIATYENVGYIVFPTSLYCNYSFIQ